MCPDASFALAYYADTFEITPDLVRAVLPRRSSRLTDEQIPAAVAHVVGEGDGPDLAVDKFVPK